MTRLVGTYSGEELTVTFTATEAGDTVENVEVHSVELLGVSVRFHDMPAVAHERIMALRSEIEWEVE